MKIDKIVCIGTEKHGKRYGKTYCEIKYSDGKLSISGVQSPLHNGDCLGAVGQILDDINIANFAPGWNKDKLNKFITIWRKWHLNGMNPACIHQEEMGWNEDGYEIHPSEPCPVCGYKYGTKWNFREVPEDVLRFLANLPDAETKPAWI